MFLMIDVGRFLGLWYGRWSLPIDMGKVTKQLTPLFMIVFYVQLFWTSFVSTASLMQAYEAVALSAVYHLVFMFWGLLLSKVLYITFIDPEYYSKKDNDYLLAT